MVELLSKKTGLSPFQTVEAYTHVCTAMLTQLVDYSVQVMTSDKEKHHNQTRKALEDVVMFMANADELFSQTVKLMIYRIT